MSIRTESLNGGRASKGWARELGRLTFGTRPRRIVSLLVMLWVLSVFDLIFTLMAHEIGGFVELNPVARPMLNNPAALTAFKLGCLGIGTAILIALRRHRITELVAWGLSAVYVALSFTWHAYYG